MIAAYLAAASVDLAPPKAIFFNDRLGELMVRATEQDLDTIQKAIGMINQTPPQVTAEAKSSETFQGVSLSSRPSAWTPTRSCKVFKPSRSTKPTLLCPSPLCRRQCAAGSLH